jgi:AraC-like DNA-binding protein
MPGSGSSTLKAPRTLSAAYARVVLSHVLQARPEMRASLSPAQLQYLDESDPLARCTLQAWHEMLDLAEHVLGGRDVVPEVAEQFKPWHAGLLGFTLMTCSSVNELSALLARFHHLLNDVFSVECGVLDERFFLRLRAASHEKSHRLARFSLTVWAQRLRTLTGRHDLKLDVSFSGPAPCDLAPYRRIFGGVVRFDQDADTMWGEAACLNMPIVSRDTASHGVLQGQAQAQLAQLSRGEDRFADKLRRLIGERLESGKVTLEDIAQALDMAPRTLQRRLVEAGLNFRVMVDELRQAQAEHLLRGTRMPLAELASSLGFSDHASFNRAFKRWTGSSPGAFRRSGVLTAKAELADPADQAHRAEHVATNQG